MKILIAEDSRISRRLLEALLQKWGYEVLSTSDGNEAWTALQAEGAPQLAVLDWMMPGMDGTEICRRIRQQSSPEPTYIILLTARTRRKDIVAGLTAGANDFVSKPFDREELRARVRVGRRVVELQSVLANRIEELTKALSQIRTLQGIIPICMHCHKIRSDEEAWDRMEAYVEKNSEAQFSHSICPDCLEKYHGEKAAASGQD